ncbi:hypothetical protein SMD44_07765 [Streptomyces alboflavus]|uniref:Uncharacterized protein n=1 Tax=Streptomyces alboflavus TaxID=67267 RepID=A0A1Z1WPC2_9ACTN|nr:hypothetical protein SMD44_07765 [Streptomyces alboflavus]
MASSDSRLPRITAAVTPAAVTPPTDASAV